MTTWLARFKKLRHTTRGGGFLFIGCYGIFWREKRLSMYGLITAGSILALFCIKAMPVLSRMAAGLLKAERARVLRMKRRSVACRVDRDDIKTRDDLVSADLLAEQSGPVFPGLYGRRSSSEPNIL